MAGISGERYLEDRLRLLELSDIDSDEHLYWGQIALADLVRKELQMGKLPSYRFNTDIGEDVGAEAIVERLQSGDGKLVVLGESGSGKTALMLEMVRILAGNAMEDEMRPVPLLLSLAVWERECYDIDSWIMVKLGRKVTLEWLKDGRLVVFLDGLDAVSVGVRSELIEKINAFMEKYPNIGLVVSGEARLDAWSELKIRDRVVLRKLMGEQVRQYLDGWGAGVEGIKWAIGQEPSLSEMARSPLMLGLLLLAFHHRTGEAILEEDLETETDVMSAFMARRLNKVDDDVEFSRETILKTLAWYGHQLRLHDRIAADLLKDVDGTWLSSEAGIRDLHHWRTRWSNPMQIGIPLWILGFWSPFLWFGAFAISYPLFNAIGAYNSWKADRALVFLGMYSYEQSHSRFRYFLRYLQWTFIGSILVIYPILFIQGLGNEISRTATMAAVICFIYLFFGSSLLTAEPIGNNGHHFLGSKRLRRILEREGSIPVDCSILFGYTEYDLRLMTEVDRMTGFVHGSVRDYFAAMYAGPEGSSANDLM
jgi:hypothetical protein